MLPNTPQLLNILDSYSLPLFSGKNYKVYIGPNNFSFSRRQKVLKPFSFFLSFPSPPSYIIPSSTLLCEFSKTKLYHLSLTLYLSHTHTHTHTLSQTQNLNQPRVEFVIFIIIIINIIIIIIKDHQTLKKSQTFPFIDSSTFILRPIKATPPKQTCVVELAVAELGAPEPSGFKRRPVIQCIVTAL